jgi:alkylation response protein AidB-like acyl-CoA dehydrogenase
MERSLEARLSEDQQLLVETAARLADEIGCPPPPQLPPRGDDVIGWELLTETGLVCMHVGESHGGGDAHSSDVALVAEQLGARTAIVPFLGQAVLAPELAWRAGASPALLGEIADGTRRITIALDEQLTRIGGAGRPTIAWDALGATHALLLDEDGALCLAEIDGDDLRSADITRVLRRISESAACDVVSEPLSHDTITRFSAFALAMLSADLVGVMQSAVDAATDYVKERMQFGVVVGTFQAVQHIAADAKVLLEGARSSMWYAAWAADELDPDDAMLAARQAKAYTSRVAREVVEMQTQLLGGIAITWEERAHVRVRRVLLDAVAFGDEFVQEDAIAATRLGAMA